MAVRSGIEHEDDRGSWVVTRYLFVIDRTVVFPCLVCSFREIGNTLVFLRLLEDQMSSVDVRNYVHVAPMLNLRPPNSTAQKEAKTSPFDESVNALLSQYGTAGNLTGKLTAQDIQDKANKIRAVYSHPAEKASLLRPVLIEMQNVLQDEEFRTWFEMSSEPSTDFTWKLSPPIPWTRSTPYFVHTDMQAHT